MGGDVGVRGPVRRLTTSIKARVEPALAAQVRSHASAAGLGVGEFVRRVLDDYVTAPHPLINREETHR